ncbi:hypothetical protein [Limnoglobus roseus]|uniref:Uncharacterized protein n=1 Tax=Limnoglobus roseus TaxID=2598579 RepID=A0A5C1AI32_9BACT|nr:hypothetical protein [Limnoglobus roseus]QEL19089.1 hypothetical protein PX52LOC_06146 [Limnoglobus roseus]
MLRLQSSILIEGGEMIFSVNLPAKRESIDDLFLLACRCRRHLIPMEVPSPDDADFRREVQQTLTRAGFARDWSTVGNAYETWRPRSKPPIRSAPRKGAAKAGA